MNHDLKEIMDEVKGIGLALRQFQQHIDSRLDDLNKNIDTRIKKAMATRPGWGLWAVVLAIAIVGLFLPK
jgi:uncharacterized protein (UPF0335 family)